MKVEEDDSVWLNEIAKLECQYQAKIDELELKVMDQQCLHECQLEALIRDYEEQLSDVKLQSTQTRRPESSKSTAEIGINTTTMDEAEVSEGQQRKQIKVLEHQIEALKIEMQAQESMLSTCERILVGWDNESEPFPSDSRWKPNYLFELLKCWRKKVFDLMLQNENQRRDTENQRQSHATTILEYRNEIKLLQKDLTLAKANSLSIRSESQMKSFELQKVRAQKDELEKELVRAERALEPFKRLQIESFGKFTHSFWRLNSKVDALIELPELGDKLFSRLEKLELQVKRLVMAKEFKKSKPKRSIAVETDLSIHDITRELQYYKCERDKILESMQKIQAEATQKLEEREKLYEKEISSLLRDIGLLQKQVAHLDSSNHESIVQMTMPMTPQKKANLHSTSPNLNNNNGVAMSSNVVAKLESLQGLTERLLKDSSSKSKIQIN